MQLRLPALFLPSTWFIFNENTKNWYTIDALGAIFAIFTILDTFSKINCWIYFKNVDAVGDLGPGGLSSANCG